MKDYKYTNFLDYLVCFYNKRGESKLTGVITDSQVVVEVKGREEGDHWDTIEEIHKKIYPNESVEKEKIFPDAIVFFSDGDNFITDLPEEISLPQLETFLDYLRQIRTFEQEIGGTIHMIDAPANLAVEAKKRLVENKRQGVAEVIIGEDIKIKKRTN